MSSEDPNIPEGMMKKFCIRFQIKSNDPVRFMDFYHAGDRMSYVDGDYLTILRFREDKVVNTTQKFPNGIIRVKYLDGKNLMVHSSYKNDEYHLRIYDIVADKDKHVRALAGHSREVTSLSVRLGDPEISKPDLVLSTALDKRLYLWDVQNLDFISKLEFPSPAIATFHPGGNLFTVGYDSHILEIYDIRNLKEKVAGFELDRDHDEKLNWKEMQYSPGGHSLMITTDSGCIQLIDPDEEKYIHKFRNYSNYDREDIGASFDWFGDYIFGGSSNGLVNVWNLKTGSKICNYKLRNKILNVQFNPKLLMFATSGTDGVKIWTIVDDE